MPHRSYARALFFLEIAPQCEVLEVLWLRASAPKAPDLGSAESSALCWDDSEQREMTPLGCPKGNLSSLFLYYL